MAMRQKLGLIPQPYEGPPLKHRPGHLKWGMPANLVKEEQQMKKMTEVEKSQVVFDKQLEKRQSFIAMRDDILFGSSNPEEVKRRFEGYSKYM